MIRINRYFNSLKEAEYWPHCSKFICFTFLSSSKIAHIFTRIQKVEGPEETIIFVTVFI